MKFVSKALRVAHVNEASHSQHAYAGTEWAILPLFPAAEHHRTLAGTSILIPQPHSG